MELPTGGPATIPTESIDPNPVNPRRYFNDESLDILRTSIQEVGILVPLIVYKDSSATDRYVLLDGERRLSCALTLGLPTVPVNITPEPTKIQNILRMFNIHAVREDWPLVSVALSLDTVMGELNEQRESRLAELTGLTRATVRRAKRLLSLPSSELELIRQEAHLPRSQQIHREDLYLEIEAAVSVLQKSFPEIGTEYSRDQLIRAFARKREEGHLKAITEFRNVSKIAEASNAGLVSRDEIIKVTRKLIEDPRINPSEVMEGLLAESFAQQDVYRKSRALIRELSDVNRANLISSDLRTSLETLRSLIDDILAGRS